MTNSTEGYNSASQPNAITLSDGSEVTTGEGGEYPSEGVIFTLEKYKLTLDDGSEVILSIGTPKKEQNKAKTHP
jgi:hypothetical protein